MTDLLLNLLNKSCEKEYKLVYGKCYSLIQDIKIFQSFFIYIMSSNNPEDHIGTCIDCCNPPPVSDYMGGAPFCTCCKSCHNHICSYCAKNPELDRLPKEKLNELKEAIEILIANSSSEKYKENVNKFNDEVKNISSEYYCSNCFKQFDKEKYISTQEIIEELKTKYPQIYDEIIKSREIYYIPDFK